jgi:hypothetical protein
MTAPRQLDTTLSSKFKEALVLPLLIDPPTASSALTSYDGKDFVAVIPSELARTYVE